MKSAHKKNFAYHIIVAAIAALSWNFAEAQNTGKQGKMNPSASASKNQNVKQGQGMKMRKETDKQAKARLEKLRSVSGRVLNTKDVEVRGSDTQNLVALIKTTKADRRLVVDLGPKSAYEGNLVKEGETIAAQGRVVQVRDQQFLVAQKVKHGGKVINVSRKAQWEHAQKAQQKMEDKASAGGTSEDQL